MFPRFNRFQSVLASVLVAVLIVGLRIAAERPWESATTRAHRLCSECGLTAGEVDGLIETMRLSTLTREENLELFYATFEDRSQAELCEPCAEAVLDAARR